MKPGPFLTYLNLGLCFLIALALNIAVVLILIGIIAAFGK